MKLLKQLNLEKITDLKQIMITVEYTYGVVKSN